MEDPKSGLQAGWKADSCMPEASQKEKLYLQPGEFSPLCQGFSAIPEDSNVTFLSALFCLHTRHVKDESLALASYLTDFIGFSHDFKYCIFEFNRTCLQFYFIPKEFL